MVSAKAGPSFSGGNSESSDLAAYQTQLMGMTQSTPRWFTRSDTSSLGATHCVTRRQLTPFLRGALAATVTDHGASFVSDIDPSRQISPLTVTSPTTGFRATPSSDHDEDDRDGDDRRC